MAKKNRTKTLAVASILAALIFIFTAFIKVPVPGNANGAYMNLGDSLIYCAGLLVSVPWAAAAAAIGSILADAMLGGVYYIPATLIVKFLMGYICAMLYKNAGLPTFILACVLGGAIMVVGYGAYEWLLFGWSYVLTTITFNLIQWGAGVVGAIALYYPIKRVKGLLV